MERVFRNMTTVLYVMERVSGLKYHIQYMFDKYNS